ncbi:hypothetical protein EXU57_20800 [Segetibacter sp. 3557_3]|uniref:hypothetical protein n=1 Tax=Segetibacter sp. 3557_3 TaxID=2547429 RepID=UPI00105918F6|nr:hypothetical protein [Segetibacter sp. 3557_3]TDH20836.1 hypothetical protein EXU57_20800 [Segetibacter sp. 3557_3]
MDKISILILKSLNRINAKLSTTEKVGYSESLVELSDRDAYNLIKEKLAGDNPCMIARFGNVELNCLLHYHAITDKGGFLKKSYDYIKGDMFPFWWDKGISKYMGNNAGFINPTSENLHRFCEKMIEDMAELDVLGSWLKGEEHFLPFMPNANKVKLGAFAPWNYKDPWSSVLEEKKVLIVHPYEKSIRQQFLKREMLFPDKRILPAFELLTVKAVQSIAQNETPFSDWFDALQYMEEQILKKDFDIAILGCGAYGFPLAAFIKRMGKKAINIGGTTQILFGIKGKRWENHHPEKSFFNEYWVNPLAEEIPQNFQQIEGGCYW